jgi:hypothetical protein
LRFARLCWRTGMARQGNRRLMLVSI